MKKSKGKIISMLFIKKKYILLYVYFLIYLKNNHPETVKEPIKNIFIFIHGTWAYSFSSLLFNYFEKELIKNRWKKVKNKKAEQPGLIDITNINNKLEYLNREKIILEYKKKNEKYFPNSIYYKFNWDGFLSEANRNKAAKTLSEGIKKIHITHPQAKIYIIGYSHGGNVGLKIANYILEEESLYIEKIILLATPIGEITEKLALSKKKNGSLFFKEIHCWYSFGDLTQIKDFLFEFPFPHRFLRKRKYKVFNIQAIYYYENIKNKNKKNEIFKYYPNHKDFWLLYNNRKIYNFNVASSPVVYFLPEVISKENFTHFSTFIIKDKINQADIKYIPSIFEAESQ